MEMLKSENAKSNFHHKNVINPSNFKIKIKKNKKKFWWPPRTLQSYCNLATMDIME